MSRNIKPIGERHAPAHHTDPAAIESAREQHLQERAKAAGMILVRWRHPDQPHIDRWMLVDRETKDVIAGERTRLDLDGIERCLPAHLPADA